VKDCLIFFSNSSGVAIFLRGGSIQTRNADTELLFRQESNFWYVTGVDSPDCTVLLDATARKAYLFVPQFTEYDAVWYGRLETLDQMRQRFDMDEVYYLTEFQTVLNKTAPSTVYIVAGETFPNGSYAINQTLTRALFTARSIKGPQEINLLRLVSQISSDAHVELMKMCRPGMYEYNLESRFLYETYNCGMRQQAYTPIVGSGYNSAVLHYSTNKDVMLATDIVLIDAGAEFNGYATDITRTFPVNGQWSPQQEVVYSMVLKTQMALINMLRPNAVWANISNQTKFLTLQGLLDNGFVKGSLSDLDENNISRIFLPHGVGHFVGLDVHDGYSTPTILQSGMVLTIEPGVYFNEALIVPALQSNITSQFLNTDLINQYNNFGGVRIEDTILITDTGFEVLSAGVPKLVGDITMIMNQQ